MTHELIAYLAVGWLTVTLLRVLVKFTERDYPPAGPESLCETCSQPPSLSPAGSQTRQPVVDPRSED